MSSNSATRLSERHISKVPPWKSWPPGTISAWRRCAPSCATGADAGGEHDGENGFSGSCTLRPMVTGNYNECATSPLLREGGGFR